VLNISLADAVIATFDNKFHFNYWRPITAIRAGDSDGNPATRGDTACEPLCVTPPFPEYNSTHAATAAAAAGALALQLGDHRTFTITNPLASAGSTNASLRPAMKKEYRASTATYTSAAR
jgi:membrane-associated phospholipid phosphatase